MGKKCFVIMPIGKQKLFSREITEDELKKRYSDLVKEAIIKARPEMEVVRSDEVSRGGGITTDVFTRLMHSDFVVVDVTFSNPNVFYELGIRHACHVGTIIIYDKTLWEKPFDISNERAIPYENTPTGLKQLSEDLKERFKSLESDPETPDNQFLQLAKLTKYKFQEYGKTDEINEAMLEATMIMLSNPELLKLFTEYGSGKEVPQERLFSTLGKFPDETKKILRALLTSGKLKFG